MSQRGVSKDIKQLITAAALLDVQAKKAAGSVKEMKERLTDWYIDTGKQIGKTHEGAQEGTAVTFAEADVFEAISIDDLKAMLKERGLTDKLFDCLAVNMAKLKAVLGKDDVAKLQGESIGTKYSVKLKAPKED